MSILKIIALMFLVTTLNAQKAELLDLLKGKLFATYTFVSENKNKPEGKDTSYLDCYSNQLFIERIIHRESYDSAYAAALEVPQYSVDTFKKAFFVHRSDFNDDFTYILIENSIFDNTPRLHTITYKLQKEPYHLALGMLNFGHMLGNSTFAITMFIKEDSYTVNNQEFCVYKFVEEGEVFGGFIHRQEIYIEKEDLIPIYSKYSSRHRSVKNFRSSEMKIIDIKYYPR